MKMDTKGMKYNERLIFKEQDRNLNHPRDDN